MSSNVSSFSNKEGPDFLIRFYIAAGEICRIELSANTNTGMAWQIYSNGPVGSLERAICQWVEEYGAKRPSSIDLPLSLTGYPPFTKKVLRYLQKIPFGKAMTYKQIAETLGHPLASRAVGNACGRNPFLLVIPCHRVLAAGSRLGGFTAGIEIKKNLLEFEEIILSS